MVSVSFLNDLDKLIVNNSFNRNIENKKNEKHLKIVYNLSGCKTMRVEEFDALIVGGGLSGLRAGLGLATKWEVAIVSKVHPLRSHSGAAQG